MGRKALKMEKIEDKQKRTVTFCKRSKGLFKKAKSLCELYPNLQIAVLTFSPIAGVPYTWASTTADSDSSSSSSSSFDAIVDRFLLGNNTNTNGTIGNINSNTIAAATAATTTAMMDPIGDHHRKQKKRKRSDVGLGLCEQEEQEQDKRRKNEGVLGFLEEEEENHATLGEQEQQELATTYSYSSVILDAQIDGGAGDDEHHGDEGDEKKLEEEDNKKLREGFWLLDDEITANLEEDELGPACWFTMEELLSLEGSMEELEHNSN